MADQNVQDQNEPQDCGRPSTGPKSAYFPDLVLVTHENKKALFYDDLLKGKTVLVHFMSIREDRQFRIGENIAKVQKHLGARLGKDVFIYSITSDPLHDTPAALRAYGERHGARPGWVFLTGQPSAIQGVRDKLFAHGSGHDHGAMLEDCSMAMIRYGNEATGLWGSVPSTTDPEWIAKRISWVQSKPALPEGKFKRKGPFPVGIASAVLMAAAIPLWLQVSSAQQAKPGRPMQPLLVGPKIVESTVDRTVIRTGTGPFVKSNPWLEPPGSNVLPTVYTNAFDSAGNEIPNTLPSTPTVYYNLHDGEPKISIVNATSPQDDLKSSFSAIERQATILKKGGPNADQASKNLQTAIQLGLDVLEGVSTHLRM